MSIYSGHYKKRGRSLSLFFLIVPCMTVLSLLYYTDPSTPIRRRDGLAARPLRRRRAHRACPTGPWGPRDPLGHELGVHVAQFASTCLSAWNSLRAPPKSPSMCINAPEGCQHGTHTNTNSTQRGPTQTAHKHKQHTARLGEGSRRSLVCPTRPQRDSTRVRRVSSWGGRPEWPLGELPHALGRRVVCLKG